MKITEIKSQVKNPERVSVFVDKKYSFSLTLDQLLELKLKKGQEISEAELAQFKKLSDEGKQKMRAIEWLFGRPHSIREFREYCYRKKIEKELIEVWIDEFVEKKYLDDSAFAEWFAENRARKNKSSRSIVSELISKGISSAEARSIVDSVQNDEQALRELVQKLKTRPRYNDEKKLVSYLLSKGFRYDDIRRVLSSEF